MSAKIFSLFSRDTQPANPPHNIEVEQAVLGSLLGRNDPVWSLDLEAEHFYVPAHGRIFQAIVDTCRAGGTASPITLKNHFDADEGLTELGGGVYLAKIAGLASGIFNIREYAERVTDYHNRRVLISRTTQLLERARKDDPNEPLDSILSDAFETIGELTGQKRLKVKSFYTVSEEILADLDRNLPCYSTGIPPLDEAMKGGLYARKSYCIAARPKMGKTVILSTISMNMALAGTPHLYITLEMGEKEIHQRNLARMMGVNSIQFVRRNGDGEFFKKVFQESLRQVKNCYFVDAPGLTFTQLQRIVKSSIKKYGIKGFILDYLQLVRGRETGENQVEHHEKVSSWIAQIVREEGIWALYAAQRNIEGGVRGGDAVLMAIDQLYSIEFDKESRTAFMAMEASRYTPHIDIGSKTNPGLYMHKSGPYFSEYLQHSYKADI